MLNKEHTPIALRFILAFILLSGIFSVGFAGQANAAPARVNQLSGSHALQTTFPSTGILDDFNRSNGSLGSNWSGAAASYSIASHQLKVNSSGEIDIFWAPAYFGVDQEAYVKLAAIDPNASSNSEISLLLKAQGSNSSPNAKIAVVYSSVSDTVQVWTYINSATPQWTSQGTPVPVVYSNGDIFGARALATGQVEVYKNGTFVDSRSITSWPYYPLTGYIGLSHYNASNTMLDDFSGGTMSGSPTLTPTAGPCTDPTTCSTVDAIPAYWRCNIAECTSGDWLGGVIAWPSWSAYQNNARTGDNSRSVYSMQSQALYPYMGSWANGCQVTAVTGTALIIEWQRGTDLWRETYLAPGASHTINLVSPEDNAMIEAPNGLTTFRVSLLNCNPQNIYGPTFTPTYTPTASSTPSYTPTFTSTPSDTPTATHTLTYTPTATSTPSNTPTATSTPSHTPTATFTPSPTPSTTATPTRTQSPNQPPIATNPSYQSQVIAPYSLTTQIGSTSGSLSSLASIQQSGTDDDPSAYIQFQTSGYPYMGYKSFFLPDNAQTVNISSMLLQVNFKGPSSSIQIWTWSVYDWTTGNWVSIGDNIGGQGDQWNNLIFGITSISRYVSPSQEIRIRLQSSNQNGSAKIDYQAIHITYKPVQPTPTPFMPTPLPTKSKYTFPATYTPTATP